MTKLLPIVLILVSAVSTGMAQQATYLVTPGNGNGIKFWSDDSYKIHMGTGAEYFYGPVTDYSIKTNMNGGTPGRGWTWGVTGQVPVAAISSIGNMQIAGTFTSSNARILAVDESWAEGLVVIKPSGWAGLRLARNNPSSNNYEGNWALGYTGSTGNDFSIATNNAGVQYNGVFHISNSTRNIGIGITSPGARLDISGGGSASVDLRVNGRIQTGDGANAGGIWVNAGNTQFLGQVSATTMGLWNNGAWRLNVDNSGNVGIGTTTPDATLAVNGRVHATEVKVTLAVPGPDYVFYKGYSLRTLNEVESFIEENKHLPEVPSAAEMENVGINLSEMNMLLLKKVEELTLYVIGQQKQIDELKKAFNKK